MRLTVSLIAIGNHLSSRLSRPRHAAQCRWIGCQQHIGVGRLDKVPVIIGVLTRHRLNQYRLRQLEIRTRHELVCGYELTARITGNVGHKTLDLGDVIVLQPLLHSVGNIGAMIRGSPALRVINNGGTAVWGRR